MRPALLVWALAVFVLVALAGAPAAFWSRWIPWPEGWAPQAVSGTLWRGQAERLGALAPLRWRVRLADGPALEVSAGALQRDWHAVVRGWPWAWQATLEDGGPGPASGELVRLEGAWQGSVLVRGQGRRCVAAEGGLHAPRLVLIAPWGMPLGRGDLELDCTGPPRLNARLERAGHHRFALTALRDARRSDLAGSVEPGSELAALLRQFGLIDAGQQRFETSMSW
ncbi:hypothetical protein DN824_01045 [Stutzerimonas nosocomialis]|uniref:hypothetical protein n=1 Tax=Stutzerimonas nosocomialis TaxID=1056496 RepID=UPI001107A7CC|nr:hypothetical protein [Stutzerimonas nosocomialis]TLX61341.1 hypothetical protein DN824_01045 [Stutzerimonas nosocomialis]